MSTAFWFWLLMILWLIFGLYDWKTPGTAPGGRFVGHGLLLFVLLFLLGWKVFGFPIQN